MKEADDVSARGTSVGNTSRVPDASYTSYQILDSHLTERHFVTCCLATPQLVTAVAAVRNRLWVH